VTAGAQAPKAADQEFEAEAQEGRERGPRQEQGRGGPCRRGQVDNCGRARAQLRTLDSGVRVTRTNDKGEMEYLDDKQRAAETKHAKDAIAADCPR
jgi:hypothetical protein